MMLNEWVNKVHTLAVEKGWHLASESEVIEKGQVSPERRLAWHMNIVAEIAEATEAVRDNKASLYWNTPTGGVTWSDLGQSYGPLKVGEVVQKPEGEMVELADAVIRIMDVFGFMGWDLERAIQLKHDFNVSRSFKHGGKSI